MYLTAPQAEDRLLSEYGIDATLNRGHVYAASGRLDTMGPFIGSTYTYPQERAFPRSVTLEGDTENVTPDRVLNWVALEAYKLSRPDEPGVTSQSVQHLGSKTFARAPVPAEVRLQMHLLTPYQRKSGVMA